MLDWIIWLTAWAFLWALILGIWTVLAWALWFWVGVVKSWLQ